MLFFPEFVKFSCIKTLMNRSVFPFPESFVSETFVQGAILNPADSQDNPATSRAMLLEP